MRRFLGGVAAGATIVAFAWILSRDAGPGGLPSPPAPPTVVPDPNHRGPLPPPAAALEAEPSPARPAGGSRPFPPGEIVLRAGEGYVFGEGHALPRGDPRPADLVCLDISGGAASFRCPRGGARADLPLGTVGVPEDPREAALLLTDAPEDLGPADLRLSTRIRAGDCGLGVVRASTGTVYRLALVQASLAPAVLERTARLVYSAIPVAAGGGVLAVPATADLKDVATREELAGWIALDSKIPDASFTNFLRGDYALLRNPPPELVLQEGKYLVLDAPLATKIEFNAYSGLVASKGIAADGEVRIRSYTGVGVKGEMAGTIEVMSYAHLHLAGDLTGKVNVRSYATVVIDGDLRGEVTVSSCTTFLLRGRLLGTLRITSGGSSFWFEEPMTRATAETLEGHGNELHLRSSDYAAGTHEGWTGWGPVTVGEKAWSVLAK